MGGLDAAALVQGLRSEFASGKTKSAEWRLEQLNGIVRMVDERKGEIIEAVKQDLNKPAYETLMAEIFRPRGAAAEAAQKLSEWMAPVKVGSPIPFLANAVVRSEPLGVVLIISPWNFPFGLCLDPLVGAVAAGNAALVKPSELAPATSALVAKLVPLYLDSSAVKVVEGGVSETTLLLEQRWDKIFYTGGPRVGKIVMAAAANHLTPVALELGGKSPTIVDSTTDLDLVAKRIACGKWALNNGQACVAPDYVLAEESITGELIDRLRDTVKQFYGDDASKSGDLSRIVNGGHWERLVGYLKDERAAGKIVFGGQSDKKSLYIAPTLVLDPPLDIPLMQDEIFGPVLVVITVKDVAEAIGIVNSRPKPLALYVFSNDKAVQERVLDQTSSGGVTVNDTVKHVINSALPFGGVGDSGIGAYNGKHSFDIFSHKKGVQYQDFATGHATSVYPPYKPIDA